MSRERKTKPEDWTEVRLARISYSGASAACSCGWSVSHAREKVREDSIDRHLDKRHNGRGIRF